MKSRTFVISLTPLSSEKFNTFANSKDNKIKMDFTGKIIAVLPLKSGTSAKGTAWKSQDYVLEYNDNGSPYTRKVVFNVFGDSVDQFNIQNGGEYTVSVNIDAHEYNGRWFPDIRAWRVMPAQAGYAQPTQQTQSPVGSPSMPNGMKTPEPFNANSQPVDSTSDLPF